MREAGTDKIDLKLPELYIASLGERAAVEALGIAERLRREGHIVECDIVGRSLKAQMKYANKIGARYTLIIGDSECDAGVAQLRDMQAGEQREVSLADFTL
jgi:histidyl-tRNA synthetase